MIVREAEPGDLPDIVAMALQFHAESPVFSPQPIDPIKVGNLVMEAIVNPSWLPLVAYSQGRLVGMGMFYCLDSFFGPSLEVGDLCFYIRPDRRGSLAAPAIMERVLRWAQEQGAFAIDFGVNTGINRDMAERFFKHCGFEQKGSLWRMVL